MLILPFELLSKQGTGFTQHVISLPSSTSPVKCFIFFFTQYRAERREQETGK